MGAAGLRLSAVAAAVADAEHNRAAAPVALGAPIGWRNVPSANQSKTYRDGAGDEHRVAYRFGRTGLILPDDDGLRLVSSAPPASSWPIRPASKLPTK